MNTYRGGFRLRAKRFLVDQIIEPLIPLQRLESYVVFWARLVLRVRKPLIIGITGSVGKSTTTAMIASVLSCPAAERVVGPVACTFSNMNDDLGVAATLLRYDHVFELPYSHFRRLALLFSMPARALRVLLGAYPKVMVLECGVGSTADLHRIVTIAPPAISAVTTIGAAHLEVVSSMEGVVNQKSALVHAVPPSGLVVLGDGHEFVSDLERVARAPIVKVTGRGVELSKNITRAICSHLRVPAEVVDAALADFKSPDGRLTRLELAGMTVIDDTYNANPMSMKLGLDTLAQIANPDQRRLAVLGAMSELGEDGRSYHVDLGAYARSRADVLIGVGELAKHYSPDFWFENSDICADEIERLVKVGDCMLVKGSASSRMKQVVNRLREASNKREVLMPQS